MNDFGKSTINKLARNGITVYGMTVIPGSGCLPFANGTRGYKVNNKGRGEIWTYEQVIAAANSNNTQNGDS